MDENKVFDILPAGYLIMGGSGHKQEFIDASVYESNDLLKEFLDHLYVFVADNLITSIKTFDISPSNPECLEIVDQASERKILNLGQEGFKWSEIVSIEDFVEDILRLTRTWDYIDRIVYLPETPVLETSINEED